MTWQLVVPFAAPELIFSEPLEVAIAGQSLTIHPRTPPYSALSAGGFQTAEEAVDVAKAIVRGTLVASLNLNCGVRARPDVLIIDNDSSVPDDKESPFVFEEGRPKGLRLRVDFGEPYYQLDRVRPRLISSLQAGIASPTVQQVLADENWGLATTLFVDSFFEASEEARFLTLITALEVVKDNDQKSPTAQNLIDRWKRDLTTARPDLDPVEANSIRGALKDLRQVSIGLSIRNVVSRWLGADAAQQAKGLYNERSRLVHAGLRPPDIRGSRRRAEAIVRELLVKVMIDGLSSPLHGA